ncbi:RsmB/NOP family class I SAM-dependent RNA methyltransferase [Roseomonas sp. PWR1]|uniref:RsmB/NOP family class I SAM-dependent RNA methyltransferase n=1 Tax=Roseomonas nitratireducens TaxID=2820810 RepID=A0ABS4AR49_9PROT|nr:RsmB/NOP family class I SAM-dependent RNA methyltransferase [Neoroseomonas nitratireducens]MBP0463821.1 RsmB/NOP family class I SAM-dependent RNA methyltransferase [Neoroseomonas nitratireducens]
MTPSGRVAAAIALLVELEAQCFAPDARRRPADAVASDFFRARRFIGGGDRRAVSELGWGVVRQRLRLDWHIARIGLVPTPRLLVIAYLLLVERRPRQEAEALFDDTHFGPAALDAVERRAAAALAGRALVDPAMPEGPRLNLPDWVLPGFATRFGARLAEEAAALEGEAPLDLRANLLKTDLAAAAVALAAEGIEAQATPFSPWGLRLPSRRPVTGAKAYRDGLVEVQDEGSQLIALLADARPGMRVADYCAGAAGKTLAMAATMGNRGKITACDTSAVRLEGAGKRLRRAGVDNAERHLLEPGDRWAKRRGGTFDRVLVDAPCTGTGTWRRNPDARLRTRIEDLQELTAVQHDILRRAAELVRPGGRLIYATCSLLPQENEEQMARFLALDARFAPVPFDRLWPALRPGVPAPCEGPWLALSPAAQGTDGFFCAVLERAS